MKKVTFYLSLIILVSCIVKLFVLWVFVHTGTPLTSPDSLSYIMPAKLISSGGSFWSDTLLWMRTPGYPLFLAAIFKICGEHLLAVSLVQLLLSNLLVLNAYRIGKMLANSTVGLWCAGVVALDYLFMTFFPLILSDFLFAVIISFVFYYVIIFMKCPSSRLRTTLMIGILLAIATWIRPVSYYLIPFLFLTLVLYSWRSRQFPQAWGWLILLVIPSLLLIGSWQIRNKIVIGTYQYTGIDAYNFYHQIAADIVAHEEHISFTAAQRLLETQANAYHFQQVAFNNYYRHEGLKIIAHHPVLFLRQMGLGAYHTLVGYDTSVFYQNDPQYGAQLHYYLHHGEFLLLIKNAHLLDSVKLVGSVLFNFLSIILLLSSMLYVIIICLYSKSQRSAVIACLVILGYFVLMASNIVGYCRFRVPFELMLDCFGVLGVFSFLKHDKISSNNSSEQIR